MRPAKNIARVVLLVLLCLSALAQQKPTPLSNDDILKMIKGGLQEATIIGAIQANETNFDLSVDALLKLKQDGVSDKVMEAMLAAEARKKSPASAEASTAPPASAPAVPGMPAGMMPMGLSPQMMANMPPAARQQMMTMISRMGGMNGMAGMVGMDSVAGAGLLPPEQMPKITLMGGSDKKPMVSSMAQIAASTTKGGPSAGSGAGSMLSSLASQGLSFAAIGAGPGAMMAAPALGMVTGMLGSHHGGMPTTTYVWALPARTSSVLMPTATPKFELEFAEIVGLDPDSYEPVIVNLKQTKDNYRLVGATKAKMDYMGGGNSESMIDEIRMPLKSTRKARGQVEIESASPLPAGEYGVVLRPVKKHKHKKGESQSEAEQALFYSVWDFSVK